ncbi:MAG: hypothetical protein IPH57_17955 [Saprospiraceae bacterium]|nr:hypothetical protein [Saprospiraceae bacterium]
MLIQFTVRYHTNPGQSILIAGNHKILGNNVTSGVFPLMYLDNENWRVTIEIDIQKKPVLNTGIFSKMITPVSNFTNGGRGNSCWIRHTTAVQLRFMIHGAARVLSTIVLKPLCSIIFCPNKRRKSCLFRTSPTDLKLMLHC